MAKKTEKPATMFWACRHCSRLNCLLDVNTMKTVTTTCLGCGRQVNITATEMKKTLDKNETATPVGE